MTLRAERPPVVPTRAFGTVDTLAPSAFRTAMAELPAGVSVVTAFNDHRPVGATVSAVTSLSLEPPMILICLATTSETLHALARGSAIAVNVLADGQQDVARYFAEKGQEKFARVDWSVGPHGVPELPGSAVVAGGHVHELLPGGDHVIVLIDVRHVRVAADRLPLVFHRRRVTAAQVPSLLNQT